MALNANALTSLANVKSQVDLSGSNAQQDARLELYINAASELIEKWCDRKFKAQSFTEYHHGGKTNILVPKHYPINSITELRIDSAHEFTDSDTLIASSDYTVTDDQNSILYFKSFFPRGFHNIKLIYNAGYSTVPSDLELACIWLTEWYYLHKNRGDMGRTTSSKGDESVGVLETMPKMVAEILIGYKRTEVPGSERPVDNYG